MKIGYFSEGAYRFYSFCFFLSMDSGSTDSIFPMSFLFFRPLLNNESKGLANDAQNLNSRENVSEF